MTLDCSEFNICAATHTHTQGKTRTFYAKAERWWKEFNDHMPLVHSTGRNGVESQKLHTIDAKEQRGCDIATRNCTCNQESNKTGFTIGYCTFLD